MMFNAPVTRCHEGSPGIRQRERMSQVRKDLCDAPRWATRITNIRRNTIEIAGFPLPEIILSKTILEAAHLLLTGNFPEQEQIRESKQLVLNAAARPLSPIGLPDSDTLSKTVAKHLLLDEVLSRHPVNHVAEQALKTIFCLGRVLRYIAAILGNEEPLNHPDLTEPLSHVIYKTLTGCRYVNEQQARVMEGLVVASVDHGLTPPSTQASVLAASVRAPYEVAMAQGVSNITEVHGGASALAAELFLLAAGRARQAGREASRALEEVMRGYVRDGKRIPGLGHRIHTRDPRSDALWILTHRKGIAAQCVHYAKMATATFKRISGITLPINVDGAIGAVIGDMGLPPVVADAVFILGRVSGLSAHYFEEVNVYPRMRWINFTEATYEGPSIRSLPAQAF
jgi:citrate synthase